MKKKPTSPTLVLRALEPTDYEAVHAIRVGRRVLPTTGALPFDSMASVKERCEQRKPNEHPIVACLDGKVVGIAGLRTLEQPRLRHVAIFFVEVHEDFHERGIGTALIREVLELADRWLGLVRIQLEVEAENRHAIRLYERFGFEIEGRMRANFLRDGVYADSLMMARVRSSPALPSPAAPRAAARQRRS